jgi:hypothetical protein
MKLTKQSLRQMIKEQNDRVKLKQKGMSQAKQAAELRASAKGVASGEIGGEFTPIERQLVQEIADVITEIASAPDVDLGQYRQQLNTVLTRLKKITGAIFPDEEAKAKAKAEKEPEKAPEDDSDADPTVPQEL